MDISSFDFHLPPELIAQFPTHIRDESRLLIIPEEGAFEARIFNSLIDYLNPGDVLVFNNTKVIPARLYGKRDEITIEILLHRQHRNDECESNETIWDVFAKPAKRLKTGQLIRFADDFIASVLGKKETGEVIISFPYSQDAFYSRLQANGHMPLPPYIGRVDEISDVDRYQTIYAKHEGAVAAPTAGLHFTPNLLKSLQDKGIIIQEVTLHVGAGTFQPVKVDNINDHQMHYEWCQLRTDTATIIKEAKSSGKKIVAVGTTSVRVLETAAQHALPAEEPIMAFTGETNIFIKPGYRFKIVDCLITNFHLPKSSLFMLVSAFAGLDTMRKAYEFAIKEQFRFYSYGDACMIFPHKEDTTHV